MRYNGSSPLLPPDHSSLSARCSRFIKAARVAILDVLKRKSLKRKVVSFAIALNLLVWPGPGLLARDLIDEVSKTFDGRFASSSYEAYALRSFYSTLLSLFSSGPRQRENTETRSLRVRSIVR